MARGIWRSDSHSATNYGRYGIDWRARSAIREYHRLGYIRATQMGELGRDHKTPTVDDVRFVAQYRAIQQAAEMWFHWSLLRQEGSCSRRAPACHPDLGLCGRHQWRWLEHLEDCMCDLTDWDMRCGV